MDASFLGTMVAAFIGAGAAVYSGIITESYKRHKEMQGTASALAGEIHAILNMSKKRDYENYYKSVLSILESNVDFRLTNIVGDSASKLDPIIDRHIDKLGLLNTASKLPERITTFYSYLQGIRLDLVTLATQDFPNEPCKIKAEIIREDLALWADTVKLGEGVYDELSEISQKPWWLSRYWSALAGYFKRIVTKSNG